MEFVFNFFTILIKYFGLGSASLVFEDQSQIELHEDELSQFFAFNS